MSETQINFPKILDAFFFGNTFFFKETLKRLCGFFWVSLAKSEQWRIHATHLHGALLNSTKQTEGAPSTSRTGREAPACSWAALGT